MKPFASSLVPFVLGSFSGSLFEEVDFSLKRVTVMRSMSKLVIAVFVAWSTVANAHHFHTSHRQRSFAWSVHHEALVLQHPRARPEFVEQDVETTPLQPIIDFFQKGLASIWLGGPTSDGKRVRPTDMACAHRTLPLGTVIHVTHERTKRSILVTVRDRGPYKHGRILDLTPGAATALGFDHHAGVARVTLNIVEPRRTPKQVIYD